MSSTEPSIAKILKRAPAIMDEFDKVRKGEVRKGEGMESKKNNLNQMQLISLQRFTFLAD